VSDDRPVLGIDLGTSNTAVAFVDGDEVRVITDERGRGVTPSVVCLNRYGEFVVGHFAKAQMITNPHGTLYSAKRLLGMDFDALDLQDAVKHLNFPVVDDGNNRPLCRILDRYVHPHEVSAEVLRKVKVMAETYLQMPVDDAVVTVPAHFTDRQRKETIIAAEQAGLKVLRLINEPTAAALAYGYGFDHPVTVVIYDFGGGTFDISVLRIDNGIFEVLATGGDTYLGGDDVNNRLCDYVVESFALETKIDLRQDKMAMQRVLDATEKAKIDLSELDEAIINLPRIAPNVDFNAHLYARLTRGDVEYLCTDLVDKTLEICGRVMRGARLKITDIDDVLLVGGQTRMPLVKQKVGDYFGRVPNDTLNPDHVVAVGAAIQGHTLLADDGDILLLDVTPVTLGIETLGGVMAPLIPRNSKLPHRASRVYTTTTDYQEEVRIKVYQGEERLTPDNTFLGEFVLSGIRKALRREPQIDVTFRIDASGVLSVSAMDVDTGEAQTIVIKDVMNSGLSSERDAGPSPDRPAAPPPPSSSLDAFGVGGSSRSMDVPAEALSEERLRDAFGAAPGTDSGSRSLDRFGGGVSGSRSMDAFGVSPSTAPTGRGPVQTPAPGRASASMSSVSREQPYFGADTEGGGPVDRSQTGADASLSRGSHPGSVSRSGSHPSAVSSKLLLEPGTIISGRYELLEQVGAGAFGAVYKARQLGIDRTVAIKLLLPDATKADVTAIQRFQQEANLSAKLEHPNTITIHDYGQTEDGMLFLVMEFVRGRTLQRVLREEGALEPLRCVHIMRQVLLSMHEAHSLGVVHRDMKPGNIMLFDRVGSTDVVKVLDFGIAKFITDKKEAAQDLTMAGRIVGTPRYMSPEQVRGKGAVPASDIYSLGLIMYAMLTGRKAVRGGSTVELIAAQISQDAVIDERDPLVPPSLMPILRMATAKALNVRYSRAEQMLLDLDGLDRDVLRGEGEAIRAKLTAGRASVQPGSSSDAGFFGRLFKKG